MPLLSLLWPTLLLAASGFYRADELPVAPAQLERAFAASVRVGSCSGVLLSPEGYVATSLHCIDECLRPKYDYQPALELERGGRGGFYEYLRIHEQMPARLNCPAYVLNQYAIHEFGLTHPDFVWMGRGRLSIQEKTLLAWSVSEFNTLKELNEDVVILKYLRTDERKLPCLPLAPGLPSTGAPVWAIGFPSRAQRDFPSTEHEEFASHGLMRSSVKEDPVLRGYAEVLSTAERTLYWQRLAGIWEQPHLSLTSVDAVHGNSGGMMVNEEGQLFALLFSSTKASNSAYTDANVVGVNAGHVRRELARALGETKTAEIFGCPE